MKNAPNQSRERRVPPLAHYLKVTPEIKAHAIRALREYERRQQPLNQGVKR